LVPKEQLNASLKRYFNKPVFISIMDEQTLMYILIPLMIWDLIWKGMALWRSAKNNQLKWFIAVLLINSIGIVPMIYLKFFQASDAADTEKETKKKTAKKKR
jgi:methionyl-tRNA synthetase